MTSYSINYFINGANALHFFINKDKFIYTKLYSDGLFLTFLLNLFGKNCIRTSFDFTSLAKIVLEDAEICSKSILFIGGSDLDIIKFRKNIKNAYPLLNFYCIHGYHSCQSIYLNEINKYNPDILVVGLGYPKQELFYNNLINHYDNFIGYTCGAFISQTSNNINYYPKYIDKYNLRWVYRALYNSHVRQRLLFDYPKFLISFLFRKDFRNSILNEF